MSYLLYLYKNDVRFVFTSSCFVGVCMSYLLYLHLCAIVMCSTFCVVFLFCFVMLPVSLNCPFLISPSVFPNIYLLSQGFLKNCRIFSFKRFFPEIYKRCEHIVEKYSVTSVQMMRAGSNNDNNFFYYILSSNKGIFV